MLKKTRSKVRVGGEEGGGGGKLGGRKVYTLAYADDVAMVAEDEEGMRGMMRGLERYLEDRKLQLNAEKSKMMRCRRGGGRWKKITWRWKGKVLEKVSEFRYLGYIIMRDGGQRMHVEDRIRKGAAVMGQVGVVGNQLRDGNLGMEGMGRAGEVAR
ncbi:uncharacterized protein LOC143355013 [Halictus rubicundus]|uniref:uncharacterized protein LOC143355013 n=1 Tax=Halictus rubicundus TaxID=77578 RepID=UPI004035A65B